MSNKKVLVIDFDAEFLQNVSQYLRNEGFQVLNAMDGVAGLEKFKATEPDLVIMEAMLPKLHGFELCSKISKDERSVPVIIMTGVYKDPIYKTEALHTFGATAYFEKPFPLESLRTTIRRIFNMPDAPVKKEEKKAEASEPHVLEKKPAKAPEKPPVLEKLHIEKKKESGHEVEKDVDRILEDALADFGLGSEKKKPAVKITDHAAKEKAAPAPPAPPSPPARPSASSSISEQARTAIKEAIAKEMQVKETHIKEPIVKEPAVREPVFKEPIVKEPVYKEPEFKESEFNEPEFKKQEFHPGAESPLYTESPAPERMAHEFKEELKPYKKESHKKPGSKTLWDPFLEFYPDKKKSISPRLIGIAAGVLVVSSLAFYFLKSHKNSSALDVASKNQAADTVQQNRDEQTPLSSQQLLNTIEKMGQSGDQGKNAIPKDKLAIPPADTVTGDTVRPEDVKPLAPTENSKLQIQLPDPKQAAETKEVKTEAQGQNANPEAKPNPPAAGNEANAKANLGDLVALDNVDSQPIVIRRVDPVYPPYAQNLKVEGDIAVSALISEYGDVLQVNVVRGIPGNLGFERAAQNAVKQWKFKPAQKDGTNVKVWKPITITFKLKR
jgi:TonB family protein